MATLIRKIDFRWTLLIALAACAATAAYLSGASAVSHLVAERHAIAAGQVWRLFTGPLVHATWGHLVRDLALLVGVGVAFEHALGWRWPLACVLGLVGPTALAFAFNSSLAGFYGTSGLTHTVLAAAMVHVIVREQNAPRWLRALAVTGATLLAIKVGFEAIANRPMFPMNLGPGVRQLPIAHLVGALLGVVAAFCRRPVEAALPDRWPGAVTPERPPAQRDTGR